MALSKSFQKGQVPMVCQMCEESNEIKWKCLHCDFLLCTKCQKLHKKVKSTDQHTIIDIKDIACHQQQTKDQLDFSNIKCGIHAGQTCFLFCQSCEVVVCPLCITTVHDTHKMIELAKGYEQTIKTFNSDIDQKLVQNGKVLSEIGTFKSSLDSNYELEKQKILSREKDLKNDVEKHTNKLLKELDQRKEIVMKSVNDAENRSENIDKDLDLQKKTLSQALNSNNAKLVFNIQSEEKTLRQKRIVPVNTIFPKLPKFVPGKQVIQDSYFGELTEPDFDQKQFQFKVINQYKTKLQRVQNLVCYENATVWVGHFGSHKIQKMRMTNESLQKMHKIKIASNDMTLLPSGDLLLSTKESCLQIISCSTSKVKSSMYSVYPLLTIAVHVTSDHRILVGVREDQPNAFPVNGPRQVIMMSIDGKREKVYQTDNNRRPIFTLPFKITTDNDNNIYVIDNLEEDWSGRIVALNKSNGVKWTYSGNADINKEQTFKPRDLVVTKSENIIVTDADNHMIHILNTSAECIHYLNTKYQLGIQLPNSLDIDNAGILYIGCNTYNSEPNEAKIYTVQVSGF
ncbi:Hypothetical predicted protein [Mytilus galloprovincialis]|uniref:B box-type domain-containing protein n=1 Tax=Mytilus galloprovincialis TaxID=29158 RepID=A0A8B6GDI5_MYTGA|nr:Hypothetical predicted protein [Mytilus galloprovincialis]